MSRSLGFLFVRTTRVDGTRRDTKESPRHVRVACDRQLNLLSYSIGNNSKDFSFSRPSRCSLLYRKWRESRATGHHRQTCKTIRCHRRRPAPYCWTQPAWAMGRQLARAAVSCLLDIDLAVSIASNRKSISTLSTRTDRRMDGRMDGRPVDRIKMK